MAGGRRRTADSRHQGIEAAGHDVEDALQVHLFDVSRCVVLLYGDVVQQAGGWVAHWLLQAAQQADCIT